MVSLENDDYYDTNWRGTIIIHVYTKRPSNFNLKIRPSVNGFFVCSYIIQYVIIVFLSFSYRRKEFRGM